MLETRSKGGRPAKDHLHQNRRTGEWRVRWVVPSHLIPIVGKQSLIRSLGTADYQEARRRSYGPNAECQNTIDEAQRQHSGEPEPVYAWPVQPGQPFAGHLRRTPPPPSIVAAGERYQAFLEREHKKSMARLRGEPEKTANFETIITDWIRDKSPRASSIRPYRSVMKQFAEWLGHSDAERAEEGREKLNEYKRHLLGKSSSATVKNHILIIKGLFKFAFNNDLISADPAATLDAPRVQSEKRAFTPKERKNILIAAREAEPLIRWGHWISAFSGARLSEITKAGKSDIEFEGGLAVLSVTADRAKNGKPRRIPIHSSVLREGFLDYLQEVPDGRLFPDRVGWNHSSIVNPWLRALGIKDKNASFHSHRHTFYSLANELMDGENPRIPERFAEAIAGHSDGRASRRYGDIPIATLAAYVEKLPDPTNEINDSFRRAS
jgi:integrase